MAHGCHQLRQAFKRVIFALNRHQKRVARAKGVNGNQPQRRRAVKEYVIILLPNARKRIFQKAFAFFQRNHFDFRAGEIDVRRQNVDVFKFSVENCLRRRDAVNQHVISGILNRALVHAVAAGGIPLGVNVTNQHFFTGCADRRRKVDRRGRFAHAAFLIDNSNGFSHAEFNSRTIVVKV